MLLYFKLRNLLYKTSSNGTISIINIFVRVNKIHIVYSKYFVSIYRQDSKTEMQFKANIIEEKDA